MSKTSSLEAQFQQVRTEAAKQVATLGPVWVGKVYPFKTSRRFHYAWKQAAHFAKPCLVDPDHDEVTRWEPVERVTANIIGYRIHFVTVVDRPERRGSTYPKVPQGQRIEAEHFCDTPAQTMSFVEGLRNGGDDYSSEYIAEIWVERLMFRAPAEEWMAKTTRSRSKYITV